MNLKLSEPGVAVSAGLHVLALILLLVTFTKSDEFDPMQETVPIETVSVSEFNQVMQGDKSATEVRPEALPKVEQVDPTPETKPTPPTPDAQNTVPATPAGADTARTAAGETGTATTANTPRSLRNHNRRS